MQGDNTSEPGYNLLYWRENQLHFLYSQVVFYIACEEMASKGS